MKKIIFLILSMITLNSYSQATISINGPTSVEVGIPNNFSFQFVPQYVSNNNGVTPDSFVITEWVVTTTTNGTNSFINGYIGNVNNSGNYYNNPTFNSPSSFTIPIQWGDGGGSSVNYDYVTAKVSGIYKGSNGQNIDYFNYVTAQVSVSVQRMNSPVISGT